MKIYLLIGFVWAIVSSITLIPETIEEAKTRTEGLRFGFLYACIGIVLGIVIDMFIYPLWIIIYIYEFIKGKSE